MVELYKVDIWDACEEIEGDYIKDRGIEEVGYVVVDPKWEVVWWDMMIYFLYSWFSWGYNIVLFLNKDDW